MIDIVPTAGLEELRVYDTRTRQVRRFEPLHPPQVGIYTCGPTVYAPQHLGNMRSQMSLTCCAGSCWPPATTSPT